MKTTDLKVGDIIAISTPKKFLPTAIRVFMWLWSIIRYRKIPKRGELFNHTMLVYEFPLIAEAIGKGFTVHFFGAKYSSDLLSHMVVFRLKEPLDEKEITNLKQKVQDMSFENIEYEIFNFFWWAVYILSFGKMDISPKGEKAGERVFCFEASAMILEAARPGTFENPSHVNTTDLMNDDRFEMLEFE